MKRFVVKVQSPLYSSETQPDWLVYAKGRAHEEMFQPSVELRRFMRGQQKRYFWATKVGVEGACEGPTGLSLLLEEPCGQYQDW